jgi:hypothetical protein
VKKCLLFVFSLSFLATAFQSPSAAAENADLSETVKKLSSLKVEGVYYLAFTAGEDKQGNEFNRFAINRAYVTLKKDIRPFLASRVTLDAYQDNTGDLKVRLKYLYAQFKFGDAGFITKPEIEFGLVHTPWLDFEEHVNYYRMQGTMFMERVDIFNSGDFGFTFAGYLGGEMDKQYKDEVNSKYAGRYGSFALGAYNGGGYHAGEVNQKKTAQLRLTVRPLPDVVPGLQASFLGIMGTGNTVEDDTSRAGVPDWTTNALMLSYEHRLFSVTAQYIMGNGNKGGSRSWFDAADDPLDYSGYSLFAELKPTERWRLIGRLDSFDPNADVSNDQQSRYIAGVGYDLGSQNVLLLDWDYSTSEKAGTLDERAVKLTMQVNF